MLGRNVFGDVVLGDLVLETSEVEAGLFGFHSWRRHRMDVAFPQQQVALAPQLHLCPVLRVEEHSIADLNLPHVLTGRDHGGPGEPLSDAGCRRNHQTGPRLAFAGLALERDEDAVVQHPDGQALVA